MEKKSLVKKLIVIFSVSIIFVLGQSFIQNTNACPTSQSQARQCTVVRKNYTITQCPSSEGNDFCCVAVVPCP